MRQFPAIQSQVLSWGWAAIALTSVMAIHATPSRANPLPGTTFTVAAAPGTNAPAGVTVSSENDGLVIPPQTKPFGATYGAWGARWWRWVYALPYGSDPVTDSTGQFGALNQPDGPVWFLAGTFGGSVVRSVNIPEGKAIFFPVINVLNDYPCPDPTFQPAPGQSLQDFLTEGIQPYLTGITTLDVQVDGRALSNVWNYRGLSNLFVFTGHPSWSASDSCVTGKEQRGVSDGYWVMLKPLPVGPHTVRIRSARSDGFSLDVMYYIKVVQRR